MPKEIYPVKYKLDIELEVPSRSNCRLAVGTARLSPSLLKNLPSISLKRLVSHYGTNAVMILKAQPSK